MMTAIIAFLVDTIIGDPNSRWHPVVLMGKLIGALEKWFYQKEDSDGKKFTMGAMLVLITLLVTYEAAAAVMMLSYRIPWSYGSAVAGGILLSFTISPKSLAKAGKGIYTLLILGQLEEARKKVGWIVGRDTENLDDAEIARATVETIAENTVDGIIAPLFFFVIGGVPLAVLYRAANTMDSMIGYKNDKYLYFGRAAAKLDDVLNYIPARITGVLFIFAACVLGFDYKNAYRVMLRDAEKHPSPNGGYAEATVAGALHIRLGGVNSYFGKKHFRAYMGDVIEMIAPKHIMECIRMMYTVTVMFILIVYAMFGL
ncbi:adenosylcobinamide-phosphate synthase CbiB [Selenomonas ruminis]|uniref:Cobalamin biosynthesis protein CobD n=1 Tax=Selenomonas ruminis TaxID=2593411 RepID=A0A5D6VZW1_9FIRM|nr:adenosylcobinamide-phosphate synthase CbiB [Selenomonas sp. mPRGC5]TYZ21663.1 cobalamin biosynthesis protein CobD [Selenomonas sp. mPRGC5]